MMKDATTAWLSPEAFIPEERDFFDSAFERHLSVAPIAVQRGFNEGSANKGEDVHSPAPQKPDIAVPVDLSYSIKRWLEQKPSEEPWRLRSH